MKREWAQETRDDVARLWNEGLSSGEIAQKLRLNRNQVAGLVHRMELKPHPKNRSRVERAPRPPRDRQAPKPRVVKFKPKPKPRPKPQRLDFEERKVVVPMSLRLPLVQLGPDSCKYPSWNKEETVDGLGRSVMAHTFCGHKVYQQGASYCLGHYRLCHQPARDEVPS